MKRKLRKSLSWLLTVAMIFSLFCGMIPTASAAGGAIYSNSELGINITASSSALIEKTGYFTVYVDGEIVAEDVSVQLGASNSLNITAPEYLVKFSGEENCDVAGATNPYTVTAGTGGKFSVTINLEKTSRDIPIGNYGTFSWQKNNAQNTDYTRKLTVYVNGQYAYDQEVQTPNTLTAGQYWFTPNTTLYKSDYQLNPSTSLDQGALKDIAIYLTTVCGCGQNTCLCEGGCICPKNCTCENCMGETLEENQINTGYGLLEYKEPTGSGYQLNVEIYVNGMLAFTKNDLRVKAGENGCLNFEPANGYYYYTENGYDFDAVYGQASWVQGTGYLYLGVTDEDREGPNTLKIYLWTWQEAEDVALDVWRGTGVTAEAVPGCLISFEAYDPKTNTEKTYTYQATALSDGAQPQHIPMGTQVTLTAICKDGTEVTSWSTAEGYANARLEGVKGSDGSNRALGNTAYLNVRQTSEDRIAIYINGTTPVLAPTEEQLKSILNNNIIVDCTNDEENHESGRYVLNMSSVTRPTPNQVSGNALNGYPYTIQIKSDYYVTQYNTTNGTHTPSSETKSVTLVYDGKDWVAKDGETPVTFNVTCETDHTITVNVTNGTVSYGGQDGRQELSFQVDSGEDATIQLSANSGYALDYAVVDGVDVSEYIGTDGSYTFENVSHDMTLTVVYAKDKKGNIDDNGNDTGDGTPDYRQVFIRYESADPELGIVTPELQTENLDVDENHAPVTEPIALSGAATAKVGAEFVQWTCNDVLISLAADLEDDGEKLYAYRAGETYVIQAHFEALPPVVETCKVAVEVYNGTATFNGTEVQGYILAQKGKDITITFTPDQGFEYEKATLDNDAIAIPDDGTYTIKSVEKDCKIEVWFTQSEAPEEPLTPPEDLENLLEGYIHIKCANNSDHEILDCGLLKDTYTVDGENLGIQGNTYVIQINSESYAMYYDQVKDLGNLHKASGDNLIVLTWDGLKWVVPEEGFTVKIFCNTEPEPETPEVPTPEDLEMLLEGYIHIECADNSDHETLDCGLLKDTYTVDGENLGIQGNTYVIQINSESYAMYYDQVKDLGNLHKASGDNLIVLTWDGLKWVVPEEGFTVKIFCNTEPEPETPEAPTYDQIEDLLDGRIEVQCVSDSSHLSKIYGVWDGSYSVYDGTDLENGIYIISLNAGAYAAKYNSDQYYTDKDTHNPYDGNVLVVLTWDGEEWTVSSAPIAVRVSCNESTTPEPEAPTKDDLLAQDIQVVVECTNSKVAHADATYNLSDFKDVVVTNAVKNADGTYTFTVNNSVFVDKYNEDNGYTGENKHETDDSGTAQVTLSYTEKDGKGSWTVAPGTSITFKVKCGASDTPELPTIDEILDVLYTKPVLVKCMNENREHEMEDEEYAVLEGTYKIGPLQQDENGDWTCYFEVNDPIPYLKQFINNTDSTQHMILDSNSQQILLVLIDGDWSAPNPDQYITTIEVTCDPTVVGSYDLTFNANGGFFGSDEAYGKEIYVKEDLVAGEHTLSSYVTSEDLVYSSTGEKVIFAGWTTEKQNKQVYRYNDADIPEIVETVTIEDQSVTVWAVWGYDEDEDGVADINEVVITPADITIYTGGYGYGGVTDADGDIITDTNNSGLPEPGYHIDLPANIQTWLGNGTTAEKLDTILHFEYDVEEGAAAGTRNWEMKYAGVYATDASGNPLRYVYTLEPSQSESGEIPVRILYKDGDTIVDDDQIDMSATAAHEEYTMTINPGELDQNEIQAKLTKDGVSKTLNVFIGTGKLTIRSVVEKEDNTSVIAANESSVTGNEIAAVGNNASYVVNDSEVSIDVTNNADRVQLLVDKVSDSEEFDEAMEDASLTHAKMSDGACETAYLDLVDTENGNTVVTLSRGSMDIYWPMPENADAEGIFKVVHYVGMDRESTASEESLDQQTVEVLQGDKLSVESIGGQQYIKFSTDSFSPFALVYETKDPGTGPDTDPDDDKDDDDHYTGGGGNDNDSDPTGNLSIELDVNGGDDEFTFTVYFTDEDGDDLRNNFYYNGDYTGTIGSGDEITLEGGDKIVIRNLPEGTRYEVIIETADGYTYVIDGEEGIIRTGTNEAEFTATRTVPLADPSVTGVSRWLNVTDHIAYLTGYPGGAFGPDNSMTRAEVAQMFYALLNNKNVTITKTFPDVPANAWYATAVNTLASLGMVSGDANGNYRPNDPITRAEFCVIALAFAYEPDNAVCYFSDVSRSDWFYTYVAQAASYGWIGGYTNGNFGPNDRITRAQVTTIVNNMLGRAADRDYVIDHQADLVQFSDLTRAHWGYFQIMEATNAHDYTKSNGTENWR